MEELVNETLDAFITAENGRLKAEIKVLKLKKDITLLLQELYDKEIQIVGGEGIDIKGEIIDMINKILD